jgi:hypothetical protein
MGQTGVAGYASVANGYAIYGYSYLGAYAGYFQGAVYVSGSFAVSGTKSFVVDHPLDPANKALLHACIESPERKNVYDGVGTADSAGELVVQLPAYFEALNSDFRYQLTAVGKAAPALHLKQKISQNQFIIAGAAPGQEICWQVTGIRSDPAAKLHPFVPEQDKPAHEKGLYHCPEAYGRPEEERIGPRVEAPAVPAQRPNPVRPKAP